jgi:C4-type Zn-finger protein
MHVNLKVNNMTRFHRDIYSSSIASAAISDLGFKTILNSEKDQCLVEVSKESLSKATSTAYDIVVECVDALHHLDDQLRYEIARSVATTFMDNYAHSVVQQRAVRSEAYDAICAAYAKAMNEPVVDLKNVFDEIAKLKAVKELF